MTGMRNANQAGSIQIRQHLLHSARRNFYYSDDSGMAAALCDRLIARFPLSEEADEARLLLHDIEFEFRKLASGRRTGACLYCPQDRLDVRAELKKCSPCRKFMNGVREELNQADAVVLDPDWNQTTRVSLAIAVVALPIIGVARGGIVGIGLSEIIALLTMECLFWGASKIRNYKKGILNFQP
jgi:hypothetical protein